METYQQIESIGNDIEEAIATGLAELGAARDDVQVEILDEGSRGLLGIGARPARVRLTMKKEAPEQKAEPAPSPEPTPEPTIVKPEPEPEPQPEPEPEPVPAPEPEAEEGLSELEREKQELQSVAPLAQQALEELLEKIKVDADVERYIKEPQDEDDYAKLILNVRGQDLGVLIGRRGETLDALQYIARLIVGREVQRRVNMVVDVEGYRVRRERNLRQLAKRMAERAVATGQRQVLEPMSPAERRIIHVTLRHHPDVTTESIGQGDSRKVTIFVRGSQ